jgi:AraC-like DNA-binding protein
MIYRTHMPRHPLSSFITHFVYYKDHTPNHSIDRFLPDGNTEIIIDLTTTPKYIYDNDTFTEIQACNRIWISGVRSKFISIPSGRDSEMFVLNFRKGAVYPFLRMPLHEISDRVVDGDLILHKSFLVLREALLNAGSIDAMFALAEQMLITNFLPSFTSNPFVDYAVGSILRDPAVTRIKTIADKTGFSSKHFIKIFRDNVGVNPKTFLRIIRFQKAIGELEHNRAMSWAGLAVDCGYYDQAHFIDDFKSFSGFTPVEYIARKNDLLNYVPVL